MRLPYFDSIAGGSDLNFFSALDSVMIQTANPFDITRTIIVVRFSGTKQKIESALLKHFKSRDVKCNSYKIAGADVFQSSVEFFDRLPWIYVFSGDNTGFIIHHSMRQEINSIVSSFAGGEVRLMGRLERLLRFGYGAIMDGNDGGEDDAVAGVVVGCVDFNKIYSSYRTDEKVPFPHDVLVVGRIGDDKISLEGGGFFEDIAAPRRFISFWNGSIKPLMSRRIVQLLEIDKLLKFPQWEDRNDGVLSLNAQLPVSRTQQILNLIRLLMGSKEVAKNR